MSTKLHTFPAARQIPNMANRLVCFHFLLVETFMNVRPLVGISERHVTSEARQCKPGNNAHWSQTTGLLSICFE